MAEATAIPTGRHRSAWLSTKSKLTGLLLLTIGLHLPAMLAHPMHTDESVFIAVGWQWLHQGKTLYSEVPNDKPPGIYVVDGLAGMAFGPHAVPPRMVALLAHLATILLLFGLGRLLWSEHAGLAAGLFYALSSASGWAEAHYALTEVFGLPCAAAGLLLVVVATNRGRIRWLVLAGVCLGAAVLFKQVYIFEFLAAGLLVLLSLPKTKTARGKFAALGALLIGFAIPLAMCVVYLASQGALAAAFDATVVSLFTGGIGAGPAYRIVRSRQLCMLLAWNSLVVLLGVVGIHSALRRHTTWRNLLLLWLGAALVNVAISGRFYPHQLLPLLPPLCLAAGYGFTRLTDLLAAVGTRDATSIQRAIQAGLVAVVSCFLLTSVLWNTDKSPFLRELAGYPPAVDVHRQVGQYIKAHTSSRDKIYVLGTDMPVYCYAERWSPFRYLSATVQQPVLEEQYIRDLYSHRPCFIVALHSADLRSELRPLLNQHYRKVEGLPGLYQRKSARELSQ